MREVEVNFSGGSQKRYVVTIDDDGEAVSIETVIRRGKDCGSHRRLFWHKRRGKRPSDMGLVIIGRAVIDPALKASR